MAMDQLQGDGPEVSVSGSGTGGSGSMGIDYCGVPATREHYWYQCNILINGFNKI